MRRAARSVTGAANPEFRAALEGGHAATEAVGPERRVRLGVAVAAAGRRAVGERRTCGGLAFAAGLAGGVR